MATDEKVVKFPPLKGGRTNLTGSDNRLDHLANPKSVPKTFQEDRRSVYWVDRNPPTAGPHGTTQIIASARVKELSRHRTPNQHGWTGDRPTPMWGVSDGAKKADAGPRLMSLSQHKEPHPRYLFDRTAYMTMPLIQVNEGATKASASERLDVLAKPRDRRDRDKFGFITLETSWGQYNPVAPAAKTAHCTPHVESLAEAKKYHPRFTGEKPVQWSVNESTLKAIANLRLQQLSRPRSRTLIKDDFDPYRVSMAARRAHATPRVEELCVPIPRKVRPKKAL
ncbi:testicular haploid expressed gene protein-like isoform X3 [Ostrea edulis]|uniref:testicular haploid expressed gene protein-like isoform X3 n=1 Tax=Ostrea edulis TaxID=37623 RepID=UPI002094DD33|nr:testicular haploid expressed gene protein-like isoform X3 [Ostrea edulis]